jgi:acyl carrier protein phosphodiesterase
LTIFSSQEWVFKQDSVPSQNTKTTQEWLWRNLLAFISAENWLSRSADLKPLDNKLWAVLEDMACRKRHSSLESLRRSLVKAAADIPLETERAVTAEWPEHLKACVKA